MVCEGHYFIKHRNSYNFPEVYSQELDHWRQTKFNCGCNPDFFFDCSRDRSIVLYTLQSFQFLSTCPQCSTFYFQKHSFPSEPVNQSAICTNYITWATLWNSVLPDLWWRFNLLPRTQSTIAAPAQRSWITPEKQQFWQYYLWKSKQR